MMTPSKRSPTAVVLALAEALCLAALSPVWLASCGSKTSDAQEDGGAPEGADTGEPAGSDGGAQVGADGGGQADAGPAGIGGKGARCSLDSDCESGMLCVNSAYNGVTKYCSPVCSTPSDCAFLAAPSISLAAKLQGSANIWNAASLANAYSCSTYVDGQSAKGKFKDGNKHCTRLCPENAAAVYDGGRPVSCACLPNFTGNNFEPYECHWSPAVECSVLKTCITSANPSDPCAGEISCFVNERLEGTCINLKGDSLEACAWSKCSSPRCDTSCLANTEGNVEACCEC